MRNLLILIIVLCAVLMSCEGDPQPFSGYSTYELAYVLSDHTWILSERAVSDQNDTTFNEGVAYYFTSELDSFPDGYNLFISTDPSLFDDSTFCEAYPLFCENNTDYCDTYPERCAWLQEQLGGNSYFAGNWETIEEVTGFSGSNGLKIYCADDSIEYAVTAITQESMEWFCDDDGDQIHEQFMSF